MGVNGMKKEVRILRIVLFGLGAAVIAGLAARFWIASFEAGAVGGFDSGGEIAFADDVQTNTSKVPDLSQIHFVDLEGNTVALSDYRDRKNVILVFTRGYPGYLCPFCMTQTSRLITNYDVFRRLEAEVLVVFPGSQQDAQKLINQSKGKAHAEKVPFPILLDTDFRVVDAFGIRGNLAKPATYLFDKQGELRFAYVGETAYDRPSIRALTTQLELIAR